MTATKRIPRPARERLRRNLDAVRGRMGRALARAGRGPTDARLVAVTKAASVQVTKELLDLGQTELGENRPEAFLSKYRELGDHASAASWHMIGHYQSRKIRDSLPLFDWVHSVHDQKLLVALERRAERPVQALIQVNTSGEDSKQGVAPEDLEALLEHARDLEQVHLRGLMTMAPRNADEATLRRVFASLRELRNRARSRTGLDLPELSMGMSGDFEAALMEGATLIRVGSALFEGVEA